MKCEVVNKLKYGEFRESAKPTTQKVVSINKTYDCVNFRTKCHSSSIGLNQTTQMAMREVLFTFDQKRIKTSFYFPIYLTHSHCKCIVLHLHTSYVTLSSECAKSLQIDNVRHLFDCVRERFNCWIFLEHLHFFRNRASKSFVLDISDCLLFTCSMFMFTYVWKGQYIVKMTHLK